MESEVCRYNLLQKHGLPILKCISLYVAAKKMVELCENARCIFWSGALAFHGPKIILIVIDSN